MLDVVWIHHYFQDWPVRLCAHVCVCVCVCVCAYVCVVCVCVLCVCMLCVCGGVERTIPQLH